ncbi:MAG: hypothetical protein ACE37B_04290 [Ilumatobacter sp.]|uniref:hypothetical protein n=1 Tax=Ilumatobacter sp. TaxID=1967498 RepID=UPI00391C1DB5
MTVAAIAAVGVFGAPGGAQEAVSSVLPIAAPGVNGEQRLSADGNVIVFESAQSDAGVASTSVRIHDRVTGAASDVVIDNAANPAISANGCIVTYSTFVADPAADEDPAPGADPAADEDPAPGADPAADEDPAPGADPAPDADADAADDEAADVESPADGAADQLDPAGLLQQAEPTVGTSQLWAYDRCAEAPAAFEASENFAGRTAALPAAAISADGTFVAYSVGDAVVRARRVGTGYLRDARFGAAIPPVAGQTAGDRVDMSSDGRRIVFETVATDGATPASVHLWSSDVTAADATVRRVASASSWPSISDDGSLIAFHASAGSDAGYVGVVLQTSGTGESPAVNISIDARGTRPDLAGGGNHVVFNVIEPQAPPTMAMVSWVGDGTDPFSTVDIIDLSAAANGVPATTAAASGPVVSRNGAVVAFDALDALGEVTERVVSVRTLPATGEFSAESYDLGVGDVGEILTATATFLNQGPSSFVFAEGAAVAESPFLVSATSCLGEIRPRSTCEVQVSLPVSELEDVFGSVTVTALEGSSWSFEVSGIGAPSTTSSTVPPSTTPPNTTPSNTTVTTRPPVNTTRPTTRPTTPPATRPTTTTTLPSIVLPPVLSPGSFEFAPTIVDAGRRTASFEIVNEGGSSVVLTAAAFEPVSAGFSVTSTTCGTITVGGRCGVDVEFAPTTEGSLAAELVATFGSGEPVRATVTGFGAPPPTVSAIPGVAASGQVVTIQGAGFPAGSTVELRFGPTDSREVVVNDSGVFNVPVVIMPNSPNGPMTITVAGQPETFADVTGELLVTRTGRSSPGLIGSLGANLGP